MRRSLFFVLAVCSSSLACQAPAEKAPATAATPASSASPTSEPSAAAPTQGEAAPMDPKRLCDRMQGWLVEGGAKPEYNALEKCAEQISSIRDDDPVRYKCFAGCVAKSKNIAETTACDKASCPAPVSPDAEGMRNLEAIEKGSKLQYAKDTATTPPGKTFVHTFCKSSAKAVPDALPAAGEKATVAAANWDAEPWTCLGFSIAEPQLLQYSYESNGKNGADARYVATARRKLENGKVRVMRLTGRVTAKGDVEREAIESKEE